MLDRPSAQAICISQEIGVCETDEWFKWYHVFSDPHRPLDHAGNRVINTNCSSAHSRQALSCKMAVEYDKFIESGKK